MMRIYNYHPFFVYTRISVVMILSMELTIVEKDSAFHLNATRYNFANTDVHTPTSGLFQRRKYQARLGIKVSRILCLTKEVTVINCR